MNNQFPLSLLLWFPTLLVNFIYNWLNNIANNIKGFMMR